MKIFATADLHLPGPDNKLMDQFGEHWQNHLSKIVDNWKETVETKDLIIICGDISWAKHFADFLIDLDLLKNLPGLKILVRGNHDYWATTHTQVNRQLPADFIFLKRNWIIHNNVLIAGQRFWLNPDWETDDPDSERTTKLFHREVQRLSLMISQLDLAESENPAIYQNLTSRILALHFPPLLENLFDSKINELISRGKFSQVLFGHLHPSPPQAPLTRVFDQINYRQVNCDVNNFQLVRII